MIFPVHKDMLPLHPFDTVAALLVIGLAPFVEPKDHGVDLAEIEAVESIVKKDHLGFAPISFTPELFLSDDGVCHSQAILPIDAMNAHQTDGARVVETDDETHLVILFMEARQPLISLDFIDGQVAVRRQRPHIGVVGPLDEQRNVRATRRAQVQPSPLQEHHVVLLLHRGLHNSLT